MNAWQAMQATRASAAGVAAGTPIKKRDITLKKQRWIKERLQAKGIGKTGGKARMLKGRMLVVQADQGKLGKKAATIVSCLSDLRKGSEHRCDRITRFDRLICSQVHEDHFRARFVPSPHLRFPAPATCEPGIARGGGGRARLQRPL